MPKAIVTRDTLRDLLITLPQRRVDVVGRALVRLYQRQTESERNSKSTQNDNGIGFASCDSYIGTVGAEAYLKTKSVPKWVMDKWVEPGANGYPRICKYHRQLNDVAATRNNRQITL